MITAAASTTATANTETLDTIRQMLADWVRATPKQREEACRIAREMADAKEKAIIAAYQCQADGIQDGEYFKRYGIVSPYPQFPSGTEIVSPDLVAAYKEGFKSTAGMTFEQAKESR